MSEAGWLSQLTTRLRTIGSKVREGFTSIVSKAKRFLITNIAQPLGLWHPPAAPAVVPPPLSAPTTIGKPVGITSESLSQAGKKVRQGPVRRTVGAAASTLASAAMSPISLVGTAIQGANQYLKEQQAAMEDLYKAPADYTVSPELVAAHRREREFMQQYRQGVAQARIARRQQARARKLAARLRTRGQAATVPLVLESRSMAPPRQATASSGFWNGLFNLGSEFGEFLDEASAGGRIAKSKRD